MELDRPAAGTADALASAVVQVGEDLRNTIRHFAERKAVVLRRDEHLVGVGIVHRLVHAAVPEAQLVGASAQGKAENLVTEADAYDWPAVERLLDGRDHWRHLRMRGVARAVGHEYQVGLRPLEPHNVGIPWHDRDAAVLRKISDDGLLDAPVEKRHPGAAAAAPVFLRRRDSGDKIHVRRPRHHRGTGDAFLWRERAVGAEHCAQRPRLARLDRQCARVDALQPRDAFAAQPFVKRLLALVRLAAALAHDATAHLRAGRLHPVRVAAVIPDLREGEHQQLAGVTGVGERFLIAGHRGVENQFSIDGPSGAKRAPPGNRAVL